MDFGKLVDKAWEDKSVEEILSAPPSALEGLTPAHDERLAEFGIKTVGQLANWKYARRARALADLADTTVIVPVRIAENQVAVNDDPVIELYIYVSGDRDQGHALRDAILELVEEDGFSVVSMGKERLGSWWQRIVVRGKRAAATPVGRDVLAKTRLALENAALNELQAKIDNLKSDSAAKLMNAAATVDEAVAILGTIVFIKYEGRIIVKSIDAVTANRIESMDDFHLRPSDVLRALRESAASELKPEIDTRQRPELSTGGVGF